MSHPWHTLPTPARLDVLAPDGSEIRLLAQTSRGSMVHCALPAGQVSAAVEHRTVEELWYCLRGHGQMWRRRGEAEEIVDLLPGLSLSLPTGTAFQFRNVGEETLEIVIVTLPPWPGADEALPRIGPWRPTASPAS